MLLTNTVYHGSGLQHITNDGAVRCGLEYFFPELGQRLYCLGTEAVATQILVICNHVSLCKYSVSRKFL